MEPFLLWLILTFLFIFTYNKKEFVAPSVIFTFSFVLSGIVFELNSFIWNYELSDKTKNVILSGIFTFFVGCVLAGRIIDTKKSNIDSRQFLFKVRNNKLFFICSICILLPVLRVLDIIAVTGSLNIEAYHDNEGQNIFSILIKLIGPFCNVLSIFMIYLIISNKLLKLKYSRYYYIPIIAYSIATILSSNRIEILYFLGYLFVIYFFLYKSINRKNIGFRQISLISLAVILVLSSFYILGFLTGKSQRADSGGQHIAHYAASSYVAFDIFVEDYNYSSDNLGTETFSGLTNLGSWLGIEMNYVEDRNKKYVTFGDARRTNVYTCFRDYIHDFNYFGMYIILFVEGFLCQLLYKQVKREFKRGKVFYIILYADVASYIMLASIEERIFASFITLTTILFFISIVIVEKQFLIRRLNNDT